MGTKMQGLIQILTWFTYSLNAVSASVKNGCALSACSPAIPRYYSLHFIIFILSFTSKMPISIFFSPVATVTILNKACHYHPSSQGIIFHVIPSKVVKTPIFISNSPFISFFACFLYQKPLNRKRSKLPPPTNLWHLRSFRRTYANNRTEFLWTYDGC